MGCHNRIPIDTYEQTEVPGWLLVFPWCRSKHAISRKESCFRVVTELDTVVAKFSAGLSQLCACIIRLISDDERFNMNTVGVLLPFADGAIRLFWTWIKSVPGLWCTQASLAVKK